MDNQYISYINRVQTRLRDVMLDVEKVIRNIEEQQDKEEQVDENLILNDNFKSFQEVTTFREDESAAKEAEENPIETFIIDRVNEAFK